MTSIKPIPFLALFLCFASLFHSGSSTPPKQCRRMENGGLWSTHNCTSLPWKCLCPAQSRPWAFLPVAAPAAPQHLVTCTKCNSFTVKGQFLCFIELRPGPEVSTGFDFSCHAEWSARKLMETLGKWKAYCAQLDKKWCMIRQDQKCHQISDVLLPDRGKQLVMKHIWRYQCTQKKCKHGYKQLSKGKCEGAVQSAKGNFMWEMGQRRTFVITLFQLASIWHDNVLVFLNSILPGSCTL